MEDEQGDVGQGSSGGVSESPLSGNLPSETIVENTGTQNQVEDSFEEGDGGEIMVEIVGSDVFVDGVSSHEEGGDLGSGEVGESRQESQTGDLSEANDVSGEGDGNQKAESESGFSESRDVKNSVAAKEVDSTLTESADVEGGAVSNALSSRGVRVLNDEAWNPGIEATAAVNSEQKAVLNEAADSGTPEALDHPMEGVVDREADMVEKEEVLPSSDNAPSHGEDSLASDGPTKAADGGDQTAKPDHSPILNCKGPENVKVDEGDSVVGEVGSLDAASTGGEISGTGPPEDGNRSVSTDGDSALEAKLLDGKEVSADEDKDLVLETDALVSVVHDENESTGINIGSSHGSDGVSRASPESVHEKSVVSERGEAIREEFDDVLDFEHGPSNINPPDISSGSDGDIKTNLADGSDTAVVNKDKGLDVEIQDDAKEKQANTLSPTFPKDEEIVQADSDMCIDQPVVATTVGEEIDDQKVAGVADGGGSSERGERIGSEISNQSLECKGIAEIPALDSSIENTEFPEKGSCLEVETANDMVTEDHVVASNDSDMCIDQPVIATTVGEEIDDQKVVEVADGGGSSERGERIEYGISNQSLECKGIAETSALDASTENTELLEKGACLQVETADGSPQSMKEDVPSQITETSNHGIDKMESISLIPSKVADVAAISDVTAVADVAAISDVAAVADAAAISDVTDICNPETTEAAELHVCTSILLDGGDIVENSLCEMATSTEEVNDSSEAGVNTSNINGLYTPEDHISETILMDVDEEKELGTDGPASETENFKFSNEQSMKSASSLRMNLSGYLSPPENEGTFSLSDLVWGKVRSHPWWPGQIFDPADASEKAVKYYKKDSYLVAYFGDRTFAWNDSSLLKPFRSHFSQIEKQSNSESFQNAVDCALEEVSRRVELGLACSCIPKDALAKIETQVVENTGIREESSLRYGVDQSSRACCFEPDKLLDYVRGLAPSVSSGADRLDLVIARAQLSAFYRFKGYRPPIEFPPSVESLEIDADTEQIGEEIVGSDKSKHTPGDSLQSRKERSLTELMGGSEFSPDAEDESVSDLGRKRKVLDPLIDGNDKKVSVYAAKVSTSTSQAPKPSFKIGECIRRVASQLTGSASLVKGNGDEAITGGSPKIYEHSERRNVFVSVESSSVDEMLSQLQLLAQDHKKGRNSLNIIHPFFMGFRSSIALNRRGRKKKAEGTSGLSAEEFEFDDVNDSYWTDRIVQNYSEEQLLNNRENGSGNLQVVPFDVEKSAKPGRKSRKRYSTGNYPTEVTEIDENIKRRKQESSPAELILHFAERKYVPSEINLNKMFRRFGPLMESETEVDHESGSAKVIFKRGSDAEVARNSSEKFNIFGPVLVNYQIGYTPLISVKVLPVAVPQYHEEMDLML